jgi:hypothetical protein
MKTDLSKDVKSKDVNSLIRDQCAKAIRSYREYKNSD